MVEKPKQNSSRSPRSPGYPSVSLETAIEKAKMFWGAEKRNFAPYPVALGHLGYTAKSGPGKLCLASLLKYKLLESKGKGDDRQIGLTQLALDIILDEIPNSSARIEAIQSATLSPNIMSELRNKWGAELPSDASIRTYLVKDRSFNQSAADDVIKIYKENISYSQLDGSEHKLLDQNDIERDDEHESTMSVGSFVQWTSQGQYQFPEPLPIGRIDEKDGELFAYFEGKGHAPISELSMGDPESKREHDSNHQITLIDPVIQPRTSTERKTLDEGPAVLSMPEDLSMESVQDFERWVESVADRARRRAGGQNKSIPMDNGGMLNLVSLTGTDKWRIKSYDFSWLAGLQLMTATVHAAANGWEDIDFDSPESALAFVMKKPVPSVVPE